MNSPSTELALAPLGAGDLIDRAVRLYRRHFLTLIRIAAPPVLVSAVGSTITTITFREFTATSSGMRLAVFVLLWLAGVVIIGCGSLFSIIVMGGATRNLVAHLLWDEPVSMRTTYRAVKSRFWGLLGGSFLVASWLGFAISVAFMAWFMVFYFVALASLVFIKLSNWLAGITGVLGGDRSNGSGANFVFLFGGARSLCTASDAGRRQNRLFRSGTKFFACQRQCEAFDGHGAIHPLRYLLRVGAVNNSSWLVLLAERRRYFALQRLAGLVCDRLSSDSAMQPHHARSNLDAGTLFALC